MNQDNDYKTLREAQRTMNFFDKLQGICFHENVNDRKQTDSLCDVFQNLQSNLKMILLRKEVRNKKCCSYNEKLNVTLYT